MQSSQWISGVAVQANQNKPNGIKTPPNMAEGMVIAKGELHVLYESGSAIYDDADYQVRTVHHGPVGEVLG